MHVLVLIVPVKCNVVVVLLVSIVCRCSANFCFVTLSLLASTFQLGHEGRCTLYYRALASFRRCIVTPWQSLTKLTICLNFVYTYHRFWDLSFQSLMKMQILWWRVLCGVSIFFVRLTYIVILYYFITGLHIGISDINIFNEDNTFSQNKTVWTYELLNCRRNKGNVNKG